MAKSPQVQETRMRCGCRVEIGSDPPDIIRYVIFARSQHCEKRHPFIRRMARSITQSAKSYR